MISINETAAAKCRVNALQRVREKEPRRHVGAASARPLASRDWPKACSETSIRRALVLSPDSTRSLAFDPRIAADQQCGKGTRIRRLMASPPQFRGRERFPCHFPARRISI